MNENIIIAKNDSGKLNEFQSLMDRTNACLNERASYNPQLYKTLNGTALESIVCDTMKELCSNTSFKPNDIELKSEQNFPDIITTYFNSEQARRYYGVEVKTTKENKWTSTGSSIVESSRIADVSRIFMLFGKLGAPIEFKCRSYEHCLSGIAVTHSPRYLIDMGLAESENIFAKMNTDYDTFRTANDNIEQVRQYYKNEAANKKKLQMPWWMGGTTNVNISFFVDLENELKFELISRALILFNEALSGDYKRVTLWLCSRYSVLNANIRDKFSAGGQCQEINGKQLDHPYPHIVKVVLEHLDQIENLLTCPDKNLRDEICEYWGEYKLKKNIYQQWIDRLETSFKKNAKLKYIPIRILVDGKAKVTKTMK
jgi:hypothetical protein